MHTASSVFVLPAIFQDVLVVPTVDLVTDDD